MSAPYQPGDTVSLSTTFRVAGTLTDPTTVELAVRAPDGTTETYTWAGATVTKDATGTFSKALEADAPGIWAWKWTGTGAAAGIDEGTFTVQRTLVGAPLLCSVDDVRAFLQKPDGDQEQDDVISVMIARASRAIMNYTGREFVVDGVNPQTRVFDLDDYELAGGHGIRVGDLAAAPTAVTVADAYATSVGTLDVSSDLVYLPNRRGPYDPITRIRVRPGTLGLARDYVLSVTGSWGFPQIPEDVAQACVMTVGIWMRRDIQAFTTTFNVDEGRVERPRGLPSPVIDLLSHYRGFGIA